MAMEWKVKVTTVEEAEEHGTGTWEPFAVIEDEEGTPLVICKGIFEVEGDRSSTLPGNENWAGSNTTE